MSSIYLIAEKGHLINKLSLYETYKAWVDVFSKRDKDLSFEEVYLQAIANNPILRRQIFHIKGTKFHGLHPDEKPVFKYLERAAQIASIHTDAAHQNWIFKRGLSKSINEEMNRFLARRFANLVKLNFDIISEEAAWFFCVNDPHYVTKINPIPFLDGKLLYKTDYGPRGNFKFGTFSLPAKRGNYIPFESEAQTPIEQVLIPKWLPMISTDGYGGIFNTESGFVGPQKLAYLNVVILVGEHVYAAEAVTKSDFFEARKSGLVKLYDGYGSQHGNIDVVPQTTRTFSGVSLTAKNTVRGDRYAVVKNGDILLTPFAITDYHIRGDKFLLRHENGTWGVWDTKQNKWTVEPIWNEVPEYLYDDSIIIKVRGQCGVVRTLNYSKEIVPCRFESVTWKKPDKRNLKHPFYLIGRDTEGNHSVYSRQGDLLGEGLAEYEVDLLINLNVTNPE